MRNRFVLLLGLVFAIGLIVSPIYGGGRDWTPFEWVYPSGGGHTGAYVWQSSGNPLVVRHRGYSQVNREVQEIGISWTYAKNWEILQYSRRHINQSPYTSALNGNYEYTAQTIAGVHRTSTGHWAEDFCAFGNPLMITDANYDQAVLGSRYESEAELLERLDAFRQRMIVSAVEAFSLEGWEVNDVFGLSPAPFEPSMETIIAVNKNWFGAGDYLPIFFTKEDQVAMYVLKEDDSNLLFIFENEDVTQARSVEDVTPVQVTTK